MRVPRLTVDLSALRASRARRPLVLGNCVSGLGSQAARVGLPYQVYIVGDRDRPFPALARYDKDAAIAAQAAA